MKTKCVTRAFEPVDKVWAVRALPLVAVKTERKRAEHLLTVAHEVGTERRQPAVPVVTGAGEQLNVGSVQLAADVQNAADFRIEEVKRIVSDGLIEKRVVLVRVSKSLGIDWKGQCELASLGVDGHARGPGIQPIVDPRIAQVSVLAPIDDVLLDEVVRPTPDQAGRKHLEFVDDRLR